MRRSLKIALAAVALLLLALLVLPAAHYRRKLGAACETGQRYTLLRQIAARRRWPFVAAEGRRYVGRAFASNRSYASGFCTGIPELWENLTLEDLEEYLGPPDQKAAGSVSWQIPLKPGDAEFLKERTLTARMEAGGLRFEEEFVPVQQGKGRR